MHTGYVVAAGTTRSTVAFCGLMVIRWVTLSPGFRTFSSGFVIDVSIPSYRATWAVLPWTVFIMSWTVFHRETRTLEHEEEEERLEQEELRLRSLSPIPGTNILSRDSGKKTFCYPVGES